MNPFLSSHRSRLTLLAAALAMTLSACGGDKDKQEAGDAATTRSSVGTAKRAVSGNSDAAQEAKLLSLADGPDICFRLIAEQLGQDLKVSEVSSFFSSGTAIDSNERKPAGQMKSCGVTYQSPDDPRKLVSRILDFKTGKFGEPKPIEITVMGNAADFKLEDYLIPISQVNAAGLPAIMDSQKAALEGAFSQYAWEGVRLSSPGPFSDKHTLRLDVEGRLVANDIKESGYASISTDAKTITTNNLIPR